jgi:CRISPR-associated protein Csb2
MKDLSHAEWPPSPYRLFKALLSAAKIGASLEKWNDTREQAMLWLEKQPVDCIVAPACRYGDLLNRSVPNNLRDKCWKRFFAGKNPEFEKANESKTEQAVFLDPGFLYYVWKLEDTEVEKNVRLIETLNEMLVDIPYLGRGMDFVGVDGAVSDVSAIAALRGIRWVRGNWYKETQKEHGIKLRLPVEGTFHELCKIHAEKETSVSDSILDPSFAHMVSEQYFDSTVNHRPYVVFRLVNEDGINQPYSPKRVTDLCGMIRHLTLDLANQMGYKDANFRNSVIGLHHEVGDFGHRLSYFGLPTIQSFNEDREIRRIMIADRAGSSPDVIAWVGRVLRGKELKPEPGFYGAILQEDTRREVVWNYVGSSRVWQSVTPVVLEEKFREKSLGAFLTRVVKFSGIDPTLVESVQPLRYPPHKGLSSTFNIPDSIKSKGYKLGYYMITFKQPFVGPLALGRGKDRGLGVFSAVGASTEVMKPPLSDARMA